MNDTQVIDATVAEEHGVDLERVDQHAAPVTLFRTDDPVEVVERASKVADALKGVLDRQGLTADVGRGKRHVLVEGWTTLGAMVGVTAVPSWTRPLDGTAPTGKTFGYEARVEARTLDGRVIGAAEAMCTRAEGRWKSADDYAIRSMAQTRATSKALRGPLGFVVTLAGYESTPAEEMPDPTPSVRNGSGPPNGAAATHPVRDERKATAAAPEEIVTREQYSTIVAAFTDAGAPVGKLAEFLGCAATSAAVAEYCTPEAGHLSKSRADEAVMFLRGLAQ